MATGFTSTTTTFFQETDTTVTQPATVTAPTPLQQRLNALLATPSGAAVIGTFNQLGVLGPASTSVVGKQLVNTTFSTPIVTTTIGPATIFVGDNASQPFFVPAGNVNIDAAITQTSFFNVLVQSAQPLTARGINWLSGDLHGAVQTTILDNDFRFADSLIGRGRDAGAPNVASGVAMSFAAEADGAASPLAYADRRLPTKAPPLVPRDAGVWSAWAKGDGGWARYDGDANNFGFRYRTGSGEGGLDYSIGPWLFGLGGGFRNSGITQEATGDSARINTGQVGAYGAWRGPLTVSGALTYGHHGVDTTRLVLLPPMPSTSSYGANSFGAGIEVSAIRPWFGASVQPLAGLTYNRASLDGFTEAGNPFLSIAGTATSVATLRGYLGGRVFTSFELGHWLLTPELRGRVLYDFLNQGRGLVATFLTDPTATPFFAPGLQPDRTAARLGGALNLRLDPRWLAFVSYDAELRRNEIGHFATGGVKVTW